MQLIISGCRGVLSGKLSDAIFTTSVSAEDIIIMIVKNMHLPNGSACTAIYGVR